MMTKRDYYPLEEAAAKLKYKSIAPLIYWAAKGELPVFILTGKYFVKATHIDAAGVIMGRGSNDDKLAKLARYCLQEIEAGNKQARAIIEPEPFYEYSDIGQRQNGEFRFELRHKDFLYPEPITQDNFMQYPDPVLIHDCELVILHNDFKRLQESKTGGGGDVVIEPESINLKKTKPIKGDKDRERTKHFIEWINSESNNCLKTQYCMQADLREDESGLWGKNESTFQRWIKTDEAKEAKQLLNNLKLQARTTDKKQ